MKVVLGKREKEWGSKKVNREGKTVDKIMNIPEDTTLHSVITSW